MAPDSSKVSLGDVARVELGGESSEVETFINGRPSSGIGVRLAAGANALETASAVKARIDELGKYFPPGLKVVYPVDTTPFVRLSIEEVVKTLLEAIIKVPNWTGWGAPMTVADLEWKVRRLVEEKTAGLQHPVARETNPDDPFVVWREKLGNDEAAKLIRKSRRKR